MTPIDPDRRSVLRAAGATVGAVFLAGCLNPDDPETEPHPEDRPNVNGAEAEAVEIEAGTTIVLDGTAQFWRGAEPADIEGLENPTLVLEDGGEYEMEWVNADGVIHDLQVWDADGNLVDDLQTESVDTEGEGDSLSFTASEEMTTYICQYHQASQVGELVVE